MSNRVTLAQLDEMNVTQASALPIEQIAMLFEEVVGQRLYAKRLDEKMAAMLDRRYAEKARNARNGMTGRVHLTDGDYDIQADMPKRVTWDEAGLRQVEARLIASGEPPDGYITVSRTVSESAFIKWPPSLQKMFQPYRTLTTGKPSYRIERRMA